MSRRKKLRIIIPVVAVFFLGAYAKHRLIDSKIQPGGILSDKEMDETSGIAASTLHPNVYYVHNDSGDTSRFFAIDPQGKLLTTIYYTGSGHGHGANDVEDIAVGPGPKKGKSYVYLGDVGDNSSTKSFVNISRFEEKADWGKETVAHTAPSTLYLKYPDSPRDCEAIAVDPLEKLLYVITKRWDSVSVYTTPLKFTPGDTAVLTFRTRLFFPGIKPFKWITAADISKDGTQVLVKSYEKVYYWQRKPNEPIWQTLQRPYRELPYKQERQGEAIGFTPDGKGYLTTSEGVYAPIYYYDIPAK
ncbi:hypothetical protein FPZ43_14830 [Mucilaginibacter pallidiroseus]|uniref:Uncharacterized protein n=1 Tax=Mucilaginibacter pallidiroseus TaxID=2599295 RepID=A0A563U533_9SPHI|nr:hypothetical protein [Mucilaginibacter pallidiroseus]TWR26435.1 hypothetical protein FPZ43_14830 [Mucilaginibacter pallidiroseus]